MITRGMDLDSFSASLVKNCLNPSLGDHLPPYRQSLVDPICPANTNILKMFPECFQKGFLFHYLKVYP